ncbi:MAG: acetyltransferase [Muribaculaceae bacterium]|nr:acetyltransferase [Muribaculaceae bacterium]
MKENAIILVGAGGHERSVADAATDAGYNVLGAIDRNDSPVQSLACLPVIGNDDDVADLASEALFINCIGQTADATLRRKISCRLSGCGVSFGTVIARDAYISSSAKIGEGTVILHRAVVNANASIGAHCIVNTGAIIEHDTIVEAFCHISTGAILNGGVRVGEGCMIGSGAIIKHGVSICADTVIGAGATVISNITEPGTYVGIPAKCKK